MSNQARRYLILSGVAVIAWYLCVLFLWAAQPLSDSVPVGVSKETGAPVSQSVSCYTLFASTSRSTEPLPLLGESLTYSRMPCTRVHTHARIVFAIDTLVLLAVLALLVVVAKRMRAHDAAEKLALSRV
ncbi:MAG: hypothetical protein NTX77_02485 [Actinobacteria bacterium]|nr:hypothetical protein [Actinomycetota bacterium]